LLPNNQIHRRAKIPRVGPAGTAATATGAGAAGSGTGSGAIGEADVGKMLGTSGASVCGFLSRLPMLESSKCG
jgi:hypothetical protein